MTCQWASVSSGLWCSSDLVPREREREVEIHYVHSASLAYEDGIVFTSEPSAARQCSMADRLLVLVPHELTHAPRSILEQARKLGPDITEMRAIRHTMELIAHSLCIANGAPPRMSEVPSFLPAASNCNDPTALAIMYLVCNSIQHFSHAALRQNSL